MNASTPKYAPAERNDGTTSGAEARASEPSGTLPLTGVRVVDFTHMAAGPFCTSLLGDLGADVIKVEKPGRGDALRYTDRCYPGDDGSYFLGINRNKRSVTIDAAAPEGIDVLCALVRTSDVLVENLRPGAMDRLGLGYEDVRALNERLVYCSISAFGSTGPFAEKPGMDLVVQALSGVMGLTGEPGRPPVRLAPALADLTGSLYACYGILAALRGADRDGVGERIEISLLEGQISLLSNFIPQFFATGQPAGPIGGAHSQLVPYQVFEAADGYLVVACLTNRFWRGLCKALGLEDLAESDKFRTNGDRLRHRDELLKILEPIFRGADVGYWTELLDAVDVPNAPINLLGDMLALPQVEYMESIRRVAHPVAGSVPVAGNPVRFTRTPIKDARPAPQLGEHTSAVLDSLGIPEGRVADYRRKGVI